MIIVIDNKTYILDSSYIESTELIRLDKIENKYQFYLLQLNNYLPVHMKNKLLNNVKKYLNIKYPKKYIFTF